MSNNRIVPGFDREKCPNLKMKVKKTHQASDCLIICLAGHIDEVNLHCFERRVMKAIEAGYVRLVFDLHRYYEVSVVGMAAFTGILKAVSIRGGRLSLARMKRTTRKVYAVLGFSDFLNLRRRVSHAISTVTSEEAVVHVS